MLAKTILALALLCLLIPAAPARAEDPIDWTRARAIYQRFQRGEQLSPDDQAYLDRARAARRNSTPARPPTTAPFLNLIALTDMTPGLIYKGQDGGLYGNYRNDPPDDLRKAAEATTARIVPLDIAGQSNSDGKIVLLSIGMSNTTQEFSRFKQLADRDDRKSKSLLIVDGAQGGQDAAAWLNDRTWQVAEERLHLAGASPKQVEVIWLKQALANPKPLGEFPAHANQLATDINRIIDLAREHYPNLRIVYLSNRIYAGYATTPLNPEPYAYESAFAVRDVILSRAKEITKEPIVLWGPYLWTNGTKGRADGLVWTSQDVRDDGTHPSQSGRQKVAEMLLNFFTSDALTRTWFIAEPNR
jgi:lysophospholipase L1-like esterase